MSLRPLIVISGPTASGKTNLAIKLAKDINGVIINGDSRQIYKEISIGTAKPSEEEMQNIPHYLFNYVSVKDSYSIFTYQKDFLEILKEIPETQVPIIVGGTGLYIDSVIYNYQLQENTDSNEREKYEGMDIEELRELISEDILLKLNESDSRNPRRLIRIIEKGNTNNEDQITKETYPNKYFVIDIPKEELKVKIISRIDLMVKNGLIEENKMVRENHLETYPALNSIGYQEFEGYFEGERTLEKVKELIVQNTLRYAKRQRTWFRRNKQAIWTNEYNVILKESQDLIQKTFQK